DWSSDVCSSDLLNLRLVRPVTRRPTPPCFFARPRRATLLPTRVRGPVTAQTLDMIVGPLPRCSGGPRGATCQRRGRSLQGRAAGKVAGRKPSLGRDLERPGGGAYSLRRG